MGLFNRKINSGASHEGDEAKVEKATANRKIMLKDPAKLIEEETQLKTRLEQSNKEMELYGLRQQIRANNELLKNEAKGNSKVGKLLKPFSKAGTGFWTELKKNYNPHYKLFGDQSPKKKRENTQPQQPTYIIIPPPK